MTMIDIYFSHDVNAFTDPKIRKMRGKYGIAGYGFYWALIEALRREDSMMLEYDPELFAGMADDYRVDFSVQEYVDDCVRWGLFERNDNHFFSPALIRRTKETMEKAEDLSQKRREAVNKRWARQRERAGSNPVSEPSNPEVESASEVQPDTSEIQMNTSEEQADTTGYNKKKNKNNTSPNSSSAGAGAREGNSGMPAAAYCAEYGIELTAGHYDQLREFYEQGITDDMLRYAVDESVANSKPGWAYVRKCVDAWIIKGFKTLDEVKAAKKAEGFKGNQDPPGKPPDRDAPPAPKPRFFSEGWNKK